MGLNYEKSHFNRETVAKKHHRWRIHRTCPHVHREIWQIPQRLHSAQGVSERYY